MRMPAILFRLPIITSLLSVLALAQGADTLRTFTSLRHGYTVQYPGNWHTVLKDTFYIDNFPPSKAVPAVRLPQGGASIEIVTALQTARGTQQRPSNLNDFVTLDTSAEKILQKRVLELKSGQRKLSVVEVESECCRGDVFHQTAWYFEVGGQMFVAQLICWKGDPNVDKLKPTLRQIVLSLKTSRP